MEEEKELPSYVTRMQAEQEKLASDVGKLDAYIYGETNYSALDKDERKRMMKQLFHMEAYHDVLSNRIASATGS